MEKRASLLDDEKFRRKLAKMLPKDRLTVERRIKESEKTQRKWDREEEALMRLPKEERLKKIYGKHLKYAFDEGVIVGRLSLTEGSKISGLYFQTEGWKQLRPGLTDDLKKHGVLPLGK